MRFFVSVLTLASLAFAAPVTELAKRASAGDVANIGYAMSAGTTGGSGGSTVTVSSLSALQSAVAGDSKKIVIVSGTISGAAIVKPGSNTSILGKSGASLVGVGIRVLNVNNVIVRNLKISKVLADTGDAIGVQAASKVWIDHVDLSSDRDHDKDYYDGLLDITHGCTSVTVSNSKLHDHWKSMLIGHSDNNGSEDKKITVTVANNYWTNLNSRMPSFRFGTGHIFNNYYLNSGDGINTRQGAQLLVENNVFSGVKDPLYSTDGGFAVAKGNDFGGGSNTAPSGSLNSVPYSYSLLSVSSVKSSVPSSAGATLSF